MVCHFPFSTSGWHKFLKDLRAQLSKQNEVQFFGNIVELQFFKVSFDHLHIPALCYSLLIENGVRNAAHSVALLFYGKPCGTGVTEPYIFCASGRHDYPKKTLICASLSPVICTTAQASRLLTKKLPQFLQKMQHSTELSCSGGAVCRSKCIWAKRLSEKSSIFCRTVELQLFRHSA